MSAKIHTQSIDHPEIAAAVGGIVSLLLHYTGSAPLSGEMLGAALAAVVMPCVMLAVRIGARLLARVPRDEKGSAAVTNVVLVLAIALAWLVIGCGASYHLSEGGWRLERAECGTQLTVYGDNDPEVSVICIKNAAALKVGPSVKSKIRRSE